MSYRAPFCSSRCFHSDLKARIDSISYLYDGRKLSVCVCVSPRASFQGRGKNGEIRVCVSPRACFQGRGEKRGNPCVCVCVASCLFSGPGRRTRKSVFVYVCVSPRACFKGRDEHAGNHENVRVCRFVRFSTYNVNYNATDNVRVFILLLFLGVK